MTSTPLYKIVFPEDVNFTVDKSTIEKSPKLVELFKNSLVVNIDEFSGRTFSQILTFIRCKNMNGECDDFIEKMFDDINGHDFIELVYAANYLEIHSLVELITTKFKKIINDNYPSNIGLILNVENDMTEEEKQEIKKELNFIL